MVNDAQGPTDDDNADNDLNSSDQIDDDDDDKSDLGLTPDQMRRLSETFGSAFNESLAKNLAPLQGRMNDLAKMMTERMGPLIDYDAVFAPLKASLNQTFEAFAPKLDFSGLWPNLSALAEAIRLKIDFSPLVEAFKPLGRLMPKNWLDVSERNIQGLVDLAREGYPTAWVPSAPVLDALVSAESQARNEVLIRHVDEIIANCRHALDEAQEGMDGEMVNLMRQAIEAFEQNLHAPAQALASSVLDTLCRTTEEQWPGYKKWLKRTISEDDFNIIELRYQVTLAPIGPAFAEFWTHKGDPIPETYNRHATTHAAGNIQYTKVNAIIAVLLATSLLRELFEQDTEAEGK